MTVAQNPFQEYQEPQIRAVSIEEFEAWERRNRNGGGNEPPEEKQSFLKTADDYLRHNRMVLGNMTVTGGTIFDRMRNSFAESARSIASEARNVIDSDVKGIKATFVAAAAIPVVAAAEFMFSPKLAVQKLGF
jgi:hypothetical protein